MDIAPGSGVLHEPTRSPARVRYAVTGNKGYICWLFDPRKHVFVKNEELSRLENPTPDAVLKTITSSGVGGMAGKIHGTSTYRFDDRGALILIREERQDWDDNRKCFVRTIKERRDGRMVVVSTEIVKQNRSPRRWRSWTSRRAIACDRPEGA